jgi:hypothetical protein
MWCTIINGMLLVLSIAIFVVAPNWMYQWQSIMFPVSQNAFNAAMYSFLGLYKVVWLVFNAVPYVALLIVRRK